MPIVPSRQREIQELLARLGAPSAPERDLAVARLRLLGPRVLVALQAWLGGAGALARAGALRVLEGSPDPRALELALELCRDTASVVVVRAAETAAGFALPAAVPVLAELLQRPDPTLRRAAAAGLVQLHAAGVLEALDALLALLLDERQKEALRLLALEALLALPEAEREPLLARLAESPAPAIAARARQGLSGKATRGSALEDVLDELASAPSSETLERLALVLRRFERDVPEAVRARLQARPRPAWVARLARLLLAWGAPAAIPLLHEALQALAPAPDAGHGAAAGWVHQALAELDSRIALYDLRERLAARPVHGLERLLLAAERVGDAPLCRLLPRLALDVPQAQAACATALAAIVRRERLRRSSRAFKGLDAQERIALEALWSAAPRRS
jgi:HEAT repeat protein